MNLGEKVRGEFRTIRMYWVGAIRNFTGGVVPRLKRENNGANSPFDLVPLLAIGSELSMLFESPSLHRLATWYGVVTQKAIDPKDVWY